MQEQTPGLFLALEIAVTAQEQKGEGLGEERHLGRLLPFLQQPELGMHLCDLAAGLLKPGAPHNPGIPASGMSATDMNISVN